MVDTVANRSQRHIKEAAWIRKTSRTMNCDEGVYQLSHVWDYLLTNALAVNRSHVPVSLMKAIDNG